MKKLSTVAVAGLMAVTAAANASVSRWDGFGAAKEYISDVQNIWTLPGVVAGNKNATYFELGTAAAPNVSGGVSNNPASAWGGVHTEMGPGVLGVWVNRGTNSDVTALYNKLTLAGTGAPTTGGFLPAPYASVASDAASLVTAGLQAQGRVDILYAFSLSDAVDLGVSISRANNNAKVENGSQFQKVDANALGFGLGAEFKEVSIFKLVEAGLVIDTDGMAVVNNTGTEQKIEHSVLAFGLRVGGDVAGDKGSFGRLELGLKSASGNSKDTSSPAAAAGFLEQKVSSMAWNLGYAMGKSGDKGMGLVGLMLNGSGSTNETDAANSKSDSGSLDLTLSTAGEAKFKEWLTGRAGLSSKIFQSTTSNSAGVTPTKTSTSNNGAATVSAGLTLTFGDLAIDGVLNQDVLYTGTYLVSGVAESLFGKVSATWGW